MDCGAWKEINTSAGFCALKASAVTVLCARNSQGAYLHDNTMC